MTGFLQPAIAPDGIELTDDAVALIAAYRAMTAEAAHLAEVIAEIRGQIEKHLGDDQVGLVDGQPVVTWRWDQPSTVIDTARLKTEQPEIWQAYQKPRKPSRPFRLIPPKETGG